MGRSSLFTLQHTARGSSARAGVLHTRRGPIETPVFMPVGTRATVRTQTFETLEQLAPPILLANTFHLILRPGLEVFQRLGGIHRFTSWKGAFLTDSGGFQLFSLADRLEIDEQGARFKSPVDHRWLTLTPESSLAAQAIIGSDIVMAFDHCVPATVPEEVARAAMHRTHRWALRSLDAHGDSDAAIFGIVQGACYQALREDSARYLCKLPFDGLAIGGLAVGETRTQRETFTALTTSLLPSEKPRYLMGVGTPLDLIEAVHRGVDMFDCVLPTLMAQQSLVYTFEGELRLRRTHYRLDEAPLDALCRCTTCSRHSRAYLHHLIKAEEPLGWQLLATHNLYFYLALMRQLRQAILEDRFCLLYDHLRQTFDREKTPPPPPRPRKKSQPPLERGVFALHAQRLPSGAETWTLRHQTSGETMHSVNDPMLEARRLYVEQSRLIERVLHLAPGPPDAQTLPCSDPAQTDGLPRPIDASAIAPLVVWDVGLGAGFNAMASIQALEAIPPERMRCRVHLVSFERDLDGLHLALQHPLRFPHLNHAAPHALAREGCWSSRSGHIHWTLVPGDVLEHLEGPPTPSLIYFDPFSARTDQPIWQARSFLRLRERLGASSTTLLTYSNATGVRTGLLLAGFFVARGAPSGPKEETTVALTPAAVREAHGYPLLDGRWLSRWGRSAAKWPSDLEEEDPVALEKRLRAHPQLKDLETGL